MNVRMRVHILGTFVTHPLVHIHQKKIALEIAAKIASVNRPLSHQTRTRVHESWQSRDLGQLFLMLSQHYHVLY
jgi:hypothetical protein